MFSEAVNNSFPVHSIMQQGELLGKNSNTAELTSGWSWGGAAANSHRTEFAWKLLDMNND